MWIIIAIKIYKIIWEVYCTMKTVQMTLDENLIATVDKIAKKLGTNRSAFTRRALHAAIEKIRVSELERKHREGYRRKPVKPEEFGDWEAEQVWVEL